MVIGAISTVAMARVVLFSGQCAIATTWIEERQSGSPVFPQRSIDRSQRVAARDPRTAQDVRM